MPGKHKAHTPIVSKKQRGLFGAELARHRQEIEQLQAGCEHGRLSGWMCEEWMPAHPMGSYVKLCLECDKVVERRWSVDMRNGALPMKVFEDLQALTTGF